MENEMKKMTALMLLSLIVMIGCESDNPASNEPIPETGYWLYFVQSHYSLSGIVGDTVSVDLTLHVFKGDRNKNNADRVPASNVTAFIGFNTGMGGSVAWSDTVTTNAEGIAEVTLSFVVKKGSEEIDIVAEVVKYRTSGYLVLNGYSRPTRMIITAPTHKLIAAQGMVARMTINGLVVDSSGVGVPDMVLSGRLERAGGPPSYGGIAFSYSTNSAGNFVIYYNSTGGFGVENIVMTGEIPDVPGTRLTESFRIEVVALEAQVGRLSLYGLPEQVILPDGGEAVLVLNALALDRNDIPLSGVTVNFESTVGVIQSDAVTDSVGFAHVVWHTGLEADTATISAHIPGTDFEAAGSVAIKTQPDVTDPVARISLFSNQQTVIAGSEFGIVLQAFVQTESHRFAESGTIVGFEILDGGGRLAVDWSVVGESGEATVVFIAGEELGVTRIRAFVEVGGGDRVESNDLSIRAIAGEAENMEFRVESDLISLHESTEILVWTTDSYDNPVSGEIITLASTLGFITPGVVTGETGRGTAIFRAGASSGLAEITMTWQGREYNTSVWIRAGAPETIEVRAMPFEHRDEDDAVVSHVTATVKDASGTGIGASMVVFELLNQPAAPEGAHFANGEPVDSARTANGIAIIDVFQGANGGVVLLKAYTWRDPETRRDTISAVVSIVSLPGPPVSMELDYDQRGSDGGGGLWILNVSARVFDSQLNPVRDGVPVTFTVVPADVASITNGETVGGVAQVFLSYHSIRTFDPVTVNAVIQVEQGQISASRETSLPLQRGFLTLNADPANWMFDRGRPDDTCLVRVWAILRDGHDQTINNAPIIFTTDRARFFWRNQVGGRYVQFFPEAARKYTGVQNANHNEPPGVATVYLRGKMADFYLDDFTLETGAHIEARVEGLDVVADPVTVRITRH